MVTMFGSHSLASDVLGSNFRAANCFGCARIDGSYVAAVEHRSSTKLLCAMSISASLSGDLTLRSEVSGLTSL